MYQYKYKTNQNKGNTEETSSHILCLFDLFTESCAFDYARENNHNILKAGYFNNILSKPNNFNRNLFIEYIFQSKT